MRSRRSLQVGIVLTVVTVSALFPGFAAGQTVSRPVSPNDPSNLAVKGPGDYSGAGQVVIPDSAVEKPGDIGQRVHTHNRIFVPSGQLGAQPSVTVRPHVGPPFSGYYAETPASLACIYGLTPPVAGCNPETLTTNATGGSRAIALVDAYDDPSAMADLQAYSTQFGLPAIDSSNFQVVYASGTRPRGDSGWATEESLDVDMAHALAPSAKIYLVEAASNSYTDLNAAVVVARNLVNQAGGGEISMSYGGSEFSGETNLDTTYPGGYNVVYFASTGDDPGTEYPSVSPRVVAVGGTSTSRRNDNRVAGQYGYFLHESSWSDAGAGLSKFETIPDYQSVISSRLNGMRAVPDISSDANPNTGVWIACSTGCSYSSTRFFIEGGTSVASPTMAAITNNAGRFMAGGHAELTYIYSQLGLSTFNDVSLGTCGPFAGYAAQAAGSNGASYQWDFCTGVGSPHGRGGL